MIAIHRQMIDRARLMFASDADFARAVDVKPQFVTQLKDGSCVPSPELCVRIERATREIAARRRAVDAVVIRREDIRPDLFGSLAMVGRRRPPATAGPNVADTQQASDNDNSETASHADPVFPAGPARQARIRKRPDGTARRG